MLLMTFESSKLLPVGQDQSDHPNIGGDRGPIWLYVCATFHKCMYAYLYLMFVVICQ